jgi:endonuclease-3
MSKKVAGEKMTGKINFTDEENAVKILSRLEMAYPEAGTALNFKTPFELLVAVILSAQCTDQQVNRITEPLFAKYNTPGEFAALAPEELAEEIKGCGLYRNKSRYIVEASRLILTRHGGRVPETRKELEALPGVGKKTAGVVLGVAFGGSALPVDTHVFRVARRLGLTEAKEPARVEEDLSKFIPPYKRISAHHWFIAHGRTTCRARKPACGDCCLRELCRYQLLGGKEV